MISKIWTALVDSREDVCIGLKIFACVYGFLFGVLLALMLG